ncbi:GDCCVxC domain-containing (seleno)protein [Paraburkholderia metrosideri]
MFPVCGHMKSETMPTDACVCFYPCEHCKTALRPKPRDCCVYRSYGTHRWPPLRQSGSYWVYWQGNVAACRCAANRISLPRGAQGEAATACVPFPVRPSIDELYRRVQTRVISISGLQHSSRVASKTSIRRAVAHHQWCPNSALTLVVAEVR